MARDKPLGTALAVFGAFLWDCVLACASFPVTWEYVRQEGEVCVFLTLDIDAFPGGHGREEVLKLFMLPFWLCFTFCLVQFKNCF